MNNLYHDIPVIYLTVAHWECCMIYLFLLEHRWDRIRTLLLSCGCFIFWIGFISLEKKLPFYWMGLAGLIGIIGAQFFIWVLTKTSFLNVGSCAARTTIQAGLIASLVRQIQGYLTVNGQQNGKWFAVISALVYLIAFFCFIKTEKGLMISGRVANVKVKEWIIEMMIVLMVYVACHVELLPKRIWMSQKWYLDMINSRTLLTWIGLAVLVLYQKRIGDLQREKELLGLRTALENQYEQYCSYQESVKMVQVMHHDLKHQLMGLRMEKNKEKREEWITQLEQELDKYQLMGQTGNEMLDGILGMKLLQARKNEVTFTYVADGKLLNFMNSMDICSVFGNALDNALEHAVQIEDPSHRLIHMVVSQYKNFVHIEIENYCEKEIVLQNDGLPATTKDDKEKHGYGLKSIQYIVKKYGGSMSVHTRNNWFELKILFPQ